ncbi:microtubule-associated protein 4 isoform X3 [Hippoglossus hippoglossus]|uniref:microtubule-associated protein 4 isoform X3 n=1 Tax=Hippoglossus hippoglossus TaxID=8267 RepID=UPI00148DC4C0|nr:microtubule-associated protein 4 isoform X3 [Hippoglossus hippoglossus]
MPADNPVGWADRSGDSDARRLLTKSVKKRTTNVMAELDLSLSDALTDAPQTGQVENLVERDFVAQLEAETFDDQVGETVGKTDYIPLLDDDTRADTGSALENGEQEAHGVQKPGCKLTSGGQITASRPEPQGEVRPLPLDQKQAAATDFLSGFSQPGGKGVNVELGAATLQADRPPSIAEPQHATPPAGLEAPKEHGPMLPEPQVPRSPADLTAGALADSWVDQGGCLSSDLPFSPSVNTMISRHASHLAASPDDPPDIWPSRESTAYAGGDERDTEGSDRKQKKKKKRRQKDEGSYENLESRGHPEMQALGENTPPTEEFFQRIGPRRDRGEGGWEEQLGKSGGRGKKGKSRKKLPEEWGVMAEPFVPSSAATSQITEEVMMDLGSSAPANLEASFTEVDTSHSPWKKEVYPDEDLVPAPLSEDLFSLTGAPIGPLVLNSELKATAAPFTMRSTGNTATLGSSPMTPHFGDEVDLLMESEKASLGNSQAFSPSFSPDDEVGGDLVDSGMFGNTSSLQESCIQVMPEEDTSAFSPASQSSPGVSPKGEVLASAPPLSPSDASWLLNDSQVSSNSEMFDFSDIGTSGPPLCLGLSFNTPSPAPLRSPKTTAQEFQQKEPKDETSSQKQSKKSRSSSSSSSVKSPTSPGAKKLPLQASPVVSPSSPPSVSPLGIPGSGLNPAAKPFFPSFADPLEEPAAVPPPAPTIEVKSDKMSEKKEENLEDSVKKMGHFEPLNKADQRGVKVEYASTETPAKVDKETEKEMPKDTEKEKEVKIEKEDEKVKVTEEEKVKAADKQAEKVEEVKKETEKGKEKETETEKVESMQQKEDKMTKAEESPEKSVKIEKVEKVENKAEKMENVEKMDKSEKVKVEEKSENKNIETLEKTAMKDDKEHIDKVEKTPEPQSTAVMFDTSYDKLEKEADRETKATVVVEEAKKEKADVDKAQKMEKEGEPEKPSDKPAEQPEQKSEKQEKQDQTQAENKTVEKKDDKKDKAVKADGGEKAKKLKPLANGSSTTPNKDLAGADKKTKPGAGLTKPSAAVKMRPSSAAASSGSLAAPTKRPTPTSTTSSSDKKATTARAASTATAGLKRPSTGPASRPLSSATTTATRDVKPKTTIERRPLVPKASTATSNQTGPTAATKNGTATTAASKTTTSVRTSLTTRTTPTTAAKKPLVPKTNSKPGEEKKPSTLKTSAADSTKPKTTTRSAGATTTTTTAASRTRITAAKPATPSSSTVPEKKPTVPRAPRAAFSTTATAASKTATRPGTAPAADTRNVRSKIGSTDNMKHQPGGGKVSSASQIRAVASKDTSQGKVQVVSKKLDFSHVTSRLGSKDNMKYVPGGGNVQILNKKVDLSKVTSKCGSKDNMKYKPGGGDVKIGSQKVNFREKAQSKVGSIDNLSHSPGGGNIKAEGGKETTEGNGTPLSGTQAPAPSFEPGEAGDLAAHENGLKDGAPCESESLREPQALDSSIPETSKFMFVPHQHFSSSCLCGCSVKLSLFVLKFILSALPSP